jgi:hypothetical protein
VGRRLLPALLVVVAAATDLAGVHAVARVALLAALPLAAVGAIAAFGEYLSDNREPLAFAQAILSAFVVGLLVLSSALRSNAVTGVPQAAVSAVLAALGILALKLVLATLPHARRLGRLWPAKP